MGESGAIAVLAEATANRLRFLQRELADERVEDRSAALGQEVKDALAKVVPEQRREFLEELRRDDSTRVDSIRDEVNAIWRGEKSYSAYGRQAIEHIQKQFANRGVPIPMPLPSGGGGP